MTTIASRVRVTPGAPVAEGAAAPAEAGSDRASLDAELLHDFETRIAGARTPEEYRAILESWRDDSRARIAAASGAGPDAASASADRKADASSLSDLMTGSSRVLIGSPDAKARVTAVLDPACPHCATAMTALAPRIESGEIAVEAIIVPVISERSKGLVAGVVAAADPGAAMLSHEKAMRGAPGEMVAPGDWGALPEDVRDAVRRNSDLVRAAGIGGVPFFLFEGPDGISGRSGSLPDAEIDALVERAAEGGAAAVPGNEVDTEGADGAAEPAGDEPATDDAGPEEAR